MSKEWSLKEEMEDSKKRHSKIFIISGFGFLDYLRRYPEDAEIMREAYKKKGVKK